MASEVQTRMVYDMDACRVYPEVDCGVTASVSGRRQSATLVDEYFYEPPADKPSCSSQVWEGFTEYYQPSCDYYSSLSSCCVTPAVHLPVATPEPPAVDKKSKGSRVHKCNYPGCDKSYTTRSSLCVHRRLHSGRKPYLCDLYNNVGEICGKTFLTSSHLKVHQRVHSGERPYVCNMSGSDGRVCTKAFVSSSHLHVHRQAHLGVKPYVCEFIFWDGTRCGQAFSYLHALRRHGKMHVRRALQSKLLARGETEAVLRGETSSV